MILCRLELYKINWIDEEAYKTGDDPVKYLIGTGEVIWWLWWNHLKDKMKHIKVYELRTNEEIDLKKGIR